MTCPQSPVLQVERSALKHVKAGLGASAGLRCGLCFIEKLLKT